MLNNMVSNKPLVSIIVITYNSGSYILETLKSIRDQEYKNIELIITDDCSKDDTFVLISDWLKIQDNIISFSNFKLIGNNVNSGVSGNCNIGLKEANGEWVKIIAGDDVLYPNCINAFVNCCIRNPAAKILVSKLNSFRNDVNVPVHVWPDFKFPETQAKQLLRQIKGGFIKAPAVFMNRLELVKMGGFDENYSFLEDDPLWLKFLLNGYSFYYLAEALVGYRLHDMAISNGKAQGYISPLFFDSYSRFKRDKIFPLMREKKMYLWYFISTSELSIQTEIVSNGNSLDLVKFNQKLGLKLIAGLKRIANLLFQ